MIASVIDFVIVNYLYIMSIYLAGGVVYAFVKWLIMLVKLRNKVIDIGEAEISSFLKGAPAYRDKSHAEQLQRLRETHANTIFGNYEYPPTALNNKGNLTVWAIFWPFNAVYTAFADVAKEFFYWAWRKLGDVFNALASSILPK